MVRTRAFSLIELVIVTVIIGIIAAIAVPRFSRASTTARESSLVANISLLQSAIDRYTTEHGGLSPGHDAPGSASSDGTDLISRLLGMSDETGSVNGSGYLGPYLRRMPANPFNGRTTVRIGGAAAGAGTDGWRFDPSTHEIQSDHVDGLVVVGPVEVEGEGAVSVGGGGGGATLEVGAGALGLD